MENNPIYILLYYKFAGIEDPHQFVIEHRQLAEQIGVLGRIYVANEGINGTVSGTKTQTEAYMTAMKQIPVFADIEFKIETWNRHPFKKLIVRAKQEIVAFKTDIPVNPNELTGQYLEPEDFRNMLLNDPDVVVIDTRNNYESAIGKFKNAITPDIENFRDFPKILPELEKYKHKKILTYCTGGIRCEKATALLIKSGFKHVYQLHGGIITYGQKTGGDLWEGKCYVFDERVAVVVNQHEDTVISSCMHCGKPSDRYINCTNPLCNKQILVCESCETEQSFACSESCAQHPMARHQDRIS